MPDDLGDKYPGSTNRRRFVKGVVGSSALAGIGTAAGASINTTTNPTGVGGGAREYVGVENVAGPAPRAMPQIPVRIDDDGFLMGLWGEIREKTEKGITWTVAEQELSGPGGEPIVYSNEWFQYCGVQTFQGVRPRASQDNYFRHAKRSYYTWQGEAVEPGDRVHVDDFADYREWGNDIGRGGLGEPGIVTWRSQNVQPTGDTTPAGDTIPVQIIRSPRIKQAEGDDPWLEASTREGFIAFLDKCTHFCCVPGFKAFKDSEKFEGRGDKVYCQCHQSVYDPFSLVRRSFVALPRPED